MKRAWFAVALLAASWLFGLHLFQPAKPLFWVFCALGGALLLAERPPGIGQDWQRVLAAALLLLPALIVPWPQAAALVLLAAGLLLLSVPARWMANVAWGAVQAGAILYAQHLVLSAYVVQTSRAHELPNAVVELLAMLLRLFGIDAAAQQSVLLLTTTQQIHRLSITWEVVCGPAAWCFLVGGLVLLLLRVGNRSQWSRTRRWQVGLLAAQRLVLVLLLWLPLQLVVLVSLYLHRTVLADPSQPAVTMNQFFSAWVHLLVLLAPAALAAVTIRIPSVENTGPTASRRGHQSAAQQQAATDMKGTAPPSHASAALTSAAVGFRVLAVVGIGLATALCALSTWWEPVGKPRGGRVMFVERHSTWSPSDRPYDTEHFGHDPSYSYTLAYQYLGQWFQMDRLLQSESIDRDTLSRCDVLIVKIPTEPFLPEEVDAIEAFVRRGGGLLLIGDHTNVFDSSSYLNPIARRFGFMFRHDLLFFIGAPYEQSWRPPLGAHPAVQHVPPMHFAVSCSIDPGRNRGRAVIRGMGLWNLPPDFHVDNYHPEARYRPIMQFGGFIQAWSTRHGRGRVLAFGDSTIFSNFCIFQPGKAELLRGMVDWLNRSSPFDHLGVRLAFVWSLVLVAAALFASGAWAAHRATVAWPPLVGAAVCGASLGLLAAAMVHRHAMPNSPPVRPLRSVAIDRTCSQVPLSQGAFTQGGGIGYGLLEQWIPRIGCITTRTEGSQGFQNDMVVVICPNKSVPEDFREELVRYIARGGKLLLIDSPDNMGTTSNSLLWPFGLQSIHATARGGKLRSETEWPGVEVSRSCQIRGGNTLLWIDQMPVAAEVRFGKGRVIAVGFGSLWNDASMGGEWSLVPEETTLLRSDVDPALLERYDLLFAFLRALAEDEPLKPFTSTVPDNTPSSP